MANHSLSNLKTTPLIESIALALGAKKNAVYQWRRRGVPPAWRIVIIKESQRTKNPLTLDDFPDDIVVVK